MKTGWSGWLATFRMSRTPSAMRSDGPGVADSLPKDDAFCSACCTRQEPSRVQHISNTPVALDQMFARDRGDPYDGMQTLESCAGRNRTRNMQGNGARELQDAASNSRDGGERPASTQSNNA